MGGWKEAMGRDRVIWFERGHYPTYIGFCPSARAWRREMRRLQALDEPYPVADARCTRFENEGKTVVLITLGEHLDGRCPMGRAALLVHEVVHAWQYVREDIGQTGREGKEIEAYAIQHLTLSVLEAYRKTRLTSSSGAAGPAPVNVEWRPVARVEVAPSFFAAAKSTRVQAPPKWPTTEAGEPAPLDPGK